MKKVLACGLIVLLASCSVVGQSLAPPAFEVASVKPSKPGTRGFIGAAPGGKGFTATNATLKHLLMMAYDVTERQVSGGPDWLDFDGFDISAKAESPSSRDQIYLMLRTLLADRFKVTLVQETREEPVYALVVEKAGKLQPRPNQDDNVQPLIRAGKAGTAFQNVPLSRLAWFLSTQVGRTVLDKTGLTGSYDFELDWIPDRAKDGSPNDTTGPSIFTALREQLGLRLESRRGTSDYLKVQRADKPSEN